MDIAIQKARDTGIGWVVAQGTVIYLNTVEPLWATTSCRQPPLLSDHFVNSRLISQSNSVINTSHKWPPLISDRDYLWFGLFFCFLPPVSDHPRNRLDYIVVSFQQMQHRLVTIDLLQVMTAYRIVTSFDFKVHTNQLAGILSVSFWASTWYKPILLIFSLSHGIEMSVPHRKYIYMVFPDHNQLLGSLASL